MPSIPNSKPDQNEKIRVSDILVKFIARNEKPVAATPAQVACIRDIARHILILNRDVIDVEVRQNQEPEITKEIFEFLGNGFGDVITAAEAEATSQGRKITQADIIKLIPDEKVIELARRFRQNVVEAVRQNASSTTDSI